MKFIKFDATNSAGSRPSKATICFGRRGKIQLSKLFCEKVKIKGKEQVSIIQDEDSPQDWYLLIGDPDGFSLSVRGYKHDTHFNCASLVKDFLSVFAPEAESATCNISTEVAEIPVGSLPPGCRAYSIITASVKSR